MFEGWALDVRYTLRRLRKRSTYTALTVLTLSLGVAGTAAVYAVAQRVLWEPLPVPAEDEIVFVSAVTSWSEAEFLYLRPQVEGFENIALFWEVDQTLQQDGAPARLVEGVYASAELFKVLGVSPALGPGFQPGDDVQGAEPVAVLSHSLWRELGGDPSIIGQPIELGGYPRTVVGVMPEGFWFPTPTTDAWVSVSLNPEEPANNYRLIGRLPAGRGTEAMGHHVERIASLLDERFTYSEQWDKTRDIELTLLRDHLVGSVRPALLAMLGAMALILLIACVNVAALMLGQVDSRGTELSVRTALGAGRQRLLRQLVVESLVVGVLAGLVGSGVALVAFQLIVRSLPLGALAETAALDWHLFWAAIGVALIAATAVALVPGISVARSDPQAWLARGKSVGSARRGGRLEGGLVVAQVALVLLMASGAALLIRSVANLRSIDPGVETAGVGVIDVVIPLVPTEERYRIMYELVRAVEAMPGIASAAATQRLPLLGSGNSWGIRVESRPELEPTITAFRLVTPSYFETMGIRLGSGRGLRETDRLPMDEAVVVINGALADRYLPDTDPLGQRVGFTQRDWHRIVGVVNDVAESDLTGGPEPTRYVLYENTPGGVNTWQTVVFRTEDDGNPAVLLDAARRAIQAAVPAVAVSEMTTMANVFNRAIGPARQVMMLLSLLSVLALVLGVVGVYGVVSHFVSRRRRDWGIRIALGMRPRRVVGSIVGGGSRLVSLGIVLGLAAFLGISRLLTGFLYDVGPADPIGIAGATAVLLAAGLAAAYIPARRASRIDPAVVLRED